MTAASSMVSIAASAPRRRLLISACIGTGSFRLGSSGPKLGAAGGHGVGAEDELGVVLAEDLQGDLGGRDPVLAPRFDHGQGDAEVLDRQPGGVEEGHRLLVGAAGCSSREDGAEI